MPIRISDYLAIQIVMRQQHHVRVSVLVHGARIRSLPPKLIIWDIFSLRISLSEPLGETGFEGSLLPLFFGT
jgi:hypothetical protein